MRAPWKGNRRRCSLARARAIRQGPGIFFALYLGGGMRTSRPGWTVVALALFRPRCRLRTPAGWPTTAPSLAWDAGRYPEALARLERLLTGPNRDTLRRPIALLTGECYRTTELALDGQGLVWSRDGRRLAFGTSVAEVP